MKNNNWYNHVQSQKDNFSPIDRFLKDTARDEKLVNSAFSQLNHNGSKVVHTPHTAKVAKEAVDRAYAIKYKHMSALNNVFLSFLEKVMPEGSLENIQDLKVNLKSPNSLGKDPTFNKILEQKPLILKEYDEIVSEISGAVDPWVNKFYNSQNARIVEKTFLEGFGVNDYFDYDNGIKETPTCKSIIPEIAESVAKNFKDIIDENGIKSENPIKKEVELSELEKALARIKELEKANAEKDKMLEKRDNFIDKQDKQIKELEEKNKNALDNDEVLKRVNENKEIISQLSQENTEKDIVMNKMEEDSLEKDKLIQDKNKIIEDKERMIDMHKIEIKHSEQIKKMQLDNISELKDYNLTLKERVTEWKDVSKIKDTNIKELKELNFTKDKKIDGLQIKVQELLHPSETTSNNGFEVINYNVDLGGDNNIGNDEI